MKQNNKSGMQFAICIKNEGYPASLELRKVYQVMPDPSAAAQHQLRIIDESGEDYLYPEKYFVLVRLPQKVEEALLHAS